MQLIHLSLTNFKNIAEASIDLVAGVNCFLGDNGMGKSNLLDAVYMLSFTKSFTGAQDALVINRDADMALIQGEYLRKGAVEQLSLGMGRGRRKSLKRQGKEYRRISEHIGLFPLVMAAPQDIDLIYSGGDERRRWMNMVISQSDSRYLDALMRYNAALQQRNALLRDGATDRNLFDAVEIQMEMSAEYIHARRSSWIDELRPIFEDLYGRISGDCGDDVDLRYLSDMTEPGVSLHALFDAARSRDIAVRHTTVGPHRDDIAMTIAGMPLRRTGSQGQCKSFTIALRLAQYDFLRRAVGVKPLLLLDDIFDKLDAGRVANIMALVADRGHFGQILITDTNRKHLDDIVSRLGDSADHRLWDVCDGRFTQTTAIL